MLLVGMELTNNFHISSVFLVGRAKGVGEPRGSWWSHGPANDEMLGSG